MMTENTWKTAISQIQPNEVRLRGYRIDELMTIYALEGFLARLGLSAHASNLVLKGGMLIAAFTAIISPPIFMGLNRVRRWFIPPAMER